jgi:2-hydroxychromene-2-carboxylate isomerase
MSAPIEFWFDFTSPYSYLMAEQIDALAVRNGRSVNWHPMLLGAVFKETGGRPLTDIPLKGDYSRHDFARSARYYGIPFKLPEKFPLSTVSAARGMLWLQQHLPDQAQPFALAVFRAIFREGRDVSDLGIVIEIAASLGIDRDTFSTGVASQEIKDALRSANETAMRLGIFGAPYLIVDGEGFWGVDRLPQIERWLAQGAF